jgi:hypothetical protein
VFSTPCYNCVALIIVLRNGANTCTPTECSLAFLPRQDLQFLFLS